MKFSIIMLDEALAELNALEEKYIKLAEKDYYKIEAMGMK